MGKNNFSSIPLPAQSLAVAVNAKTHNWSQGPRVTAKCLALNGTSMSTPPRRREPNSKGGRKIVRAGARGRELWSAVFWT